MINTLEISDIQKTQLIMAINFIFSKDAEEEPVLHSKSGNIEMMIYDKAMKLLSGFLNLFFLDIS